MIGDVLDTFRLDLKLQLQLRYVSVVSVDPGRASRTNRGRPRTPTRGNAIDSGVIHVAESVKLALVRLRAALEVR